ncbi:M23 family metallopeptidase [Streptomyces sp. NPDC000134]|uniref:M23 family metallopeptidase n=1 Tax=Streptomyces sp. NPDC000134 TaxID=3364536 RepID=UPI0036CE951A
MNDRHPSGTMTTPASASDADSAHYASYGSQEAAYGDLTTYDGYDTTGFATGAPAAQPPGTESFTTESFGTESFAADPLFGSLPGPDTGSYDTTGSYDSAQWSTGTQQTVNYDPYAAQHHAAYDTGAYETTAWTADHQVLAAVPSQGAGPEAGGQWDTGGWSRHDRTAEPADPTQQWEWTTGTFEPGTYDTGAYDATQWNTDGTPDPATDLPNDTEPAQHPETAQYSDPDPDDDHGLSATGELPAVGVLLEGQEEITPSRAASPATTRAGSRSASRSRRRPAKRSALLTIAVPSACVMGVAGIAAASVNTLTGDDGKETAAAAPDATPVKPSAVNSKLDTQLASLSAGADDFADRASRTQERIDLKAQQAAEKKRAAQEAARKERLRPKFALPVAQHGLSAYYGQAGINWMSVHSGIDFPVSYGTTVMAATDGTVRTQLNSAYGNMMIVTAKDGTETWYCHLSSYRVASGTTVKAGDPIAYSGDSGNSTGPHLHFEVRPAGGSAIDPLAWLRSHGLDPT